MIRLDVVNDGTGDLKKASYDVTLFLPEDGQYREVKARVENYNREYGWAQLMKRAITAAEKVLQSSPAPGRRY